MNYLEMRSERSLNTDALFVGRSGTRLTIYSIENIFKKHVRIAEPTLGGREYRHGRLDAHWMPISEPEPPGQLAFERCGWEIRKSLAPGVGLVLCR